MEYLTSLISANQFLVGGLGTVIFGSLMFALKSIPGMAYRTAKRMLTMTLEINTDADTYKGAMRLIEKNRYERFSRVYATRKNRLIPGYGHGYFSYEGVLCVYNKSLMEGQQGFGSIRERVEITFMTRNKAVLSKFVDAAHTRVPDDCVQVRVRTFNNEFGVLKKKRPMATIFASSGVKETLVERYEAFLQSEDVYLKRGIPYKFVAVLYGPPGTGKTSLVHGLASEKNLEIVYLQHIGDMESAVGRLEPNQILVIEDIDTLSSNIENRSTPPLRRVISDNGDNKSIPEPVQEKGKDYLNDMHKVLNSLDGFMTSHGLKVIMTTNHPEKLDPAILRPGRTDLMLEVGPISGADVVPMFECFYGAEAADALRSRIAHGAVIAPRTGATLQELFLTSSAEAALETLTTPSLKIVSTET